MKRNLLLTIAFFLIISITGLKGNASASAGWGPANKSTPVFFEDFAGGQIPTGWQNNLVSGMAFEFFSSPSASLAYILSEQGFPLVQAQLQSPAIDLSGFTTAAFSISHMFFLEGTHPAEQYASIEFSTDGNNWTPVFTITESLSNAGEYPVDSFDITEIAAGESQVFFRLHFNVPENMADYYLIIWEIESVTITGTSGAEMLTLPWVADLSSGELPSGWTNQVLGESGWSFFVNPIYHTVIYSVPGMQHVHARLQTPMFDLSGETTVTLDLNYHLTSNDPGNETTSLIQYSEDGENWFPLSIPDINTNGEIVNAQFDISADVAGKQVKLGFYADFPSGIDNYEIFWEIFGISLEGAGIPTYNLTFQVQDELGNLLNDAIITLEDQTNIAGDYLFEQVPAGNYDYTIELAGYYTETGVVTITDEDLVFPVTMEEVIYVVDFELIDLNFFPVDGAVITLNDTPAEAGVYSFQLPAGSYSFFISIEGFEEYAGSFEVIDQDIIVDVVLIALPSLPFSLPYNENFGGFTANQLPTGWQRTTPSWQINESDEAQGDAPEVSFEFNNYINAPSGRALLMTPWIDPLEEESLWLSFNHHLNDILGSIQPYTISIEGTHDGEIWETFWTMNPVESIDPESLLIDISSMSGNPFRIAFVVELMEGTSPISVAWYLDNIHIEAEPIPEIYTLVLEVDMSTAPGFNPATDQVFVSGSMFDWAEPGSEPELQLMSRVGDSWIWTKSMELEEGSYSYKYYLNNGWDGAEWGDEASREILLASDMIRLDFWGFIETPPLVEIILESQPEGAGTLNGSGEYYQNQAIQISAQAEEGYNFLNWTLGGEVISLENSFEFLVPASDVTLVAHFELIPEPTYVLSLLADPQEGGTLSGAGEYEAGTDIVLSAQEAEGYAFVEWTLDGAMISQTSSFTYTMPANNVQLTAHFESIPEPTYVLSLLADPEAGGTVSGGGEYEENDEVAINAVAAEGYVFIQWAQDGVVVSEDASYTLTMPAENVTLVAHFSITESVAGVAGPELKVYPNPARDYVILSTTENLIKVQILDLSGRILYSKEIIGDQVAIYPSLKTGFYLMIVETNSGRFTHKLQIKR